MAISALPTPPSRANSPSDFATKADALLGALPTFVTEANDLQADVNGKQAAASAAATTATSKAAEALTSASNAAASEASALASKITSVDRATAAAASAQESVATLAQTQYARDQALAGLGAADNSQILADLGGQHVYATDLAAQAVREMAGVPLGVDRMASFMDEPMSLLGTMARTLEFCVKLVGVPANASAYGQKGDFAWDASYLYICTAANTWKRVAIATW